jgi:hypothetical protein
MATIVSLAAFSDRSAAAGFSLASASSQMALNSPQRQLTARLSFNAQCTIRECSVLTPILV